MLANRAADPRRCTASELPWQAGISEEVADLFSTEHFSTDCELPLRIPRIACSGKTPHASYVASHLLSCWYWCIFHIGVLEQTHKQGVVNVGQPGG